MESTLSFQSRHELILRMVPRYQKASIAQKGALLDEIVATTGYARRYAMWLLNHPEEMQHVPRRRRQRTFGPEVQHALFVVWQKANQICAKRLMPYLATHIEALERERHLHLTDACRRQLLSMSAATADRLLRGPRAYGQRGLATTRAGTLLKQQIAVRTFAQWNETQPGFLEADVVASLPDTFKVKGKSQKEAEGEGQRKNSYSRTRGATQEEGSSMNRFSPLCSQWHGQVKEFFTMLHGHQKKVLALFVLGAIKAESIVVQRVAEELLEESEAKVPSIERRLQRFLSNERIEVEEVWDQFLAQVLPYWRNQRVYLILDITPFEEHAQVVSVGLLQQSRGDHPDCCVKMSRKQASEDARSKAS